jgi:hypothetical protein
MDQSSFESADPILNEMSAKIDELLDSDQFSALVSAGRSHTRVAVWPGRIP